jgi:DNA primase
MNGYIENLQEIESALDPYSVLELLLPGGQRRRSGKQLRMRCPVHGGNGEGNFSFNIEDHAWFCHSRGCKGRGLINLYCKSMQISFIEAAKELAARFSIPIRLMDHDRFVNGFLGRQFQRPAQDLSFTPKQSQMPSNVWQEQGMRFVQQTHNSATKHPVDLELRENRGLDIKTIIKFRIGWNELKRKDAPNLWGISSQDKIRIPRGIVIPTFFEGRLIRLKIRRSDWKPGDKHKYQIIPGSRSMPSFFGTISHMPIFIVESELDAILLQQFADDLCCCMAIPAGQYPDACAHQILQAAPMLIYSLDYDGAGTKAYSFWKSTYPRLKIWLSDKGKSPGDDLKHGVDLREWVKAGLLQ